MNLPWPLSHLHQGSSSVSYPIHIWHLIPHPSPVPYTTSCAQDLQLLSWAMALALSRVTVSPLFLHPLMMWPSDGPLGNAAVDPTESSVHSMSTTHPALIQSPRHGTKSTPWPVFLTVPFLCPPSPTCTLSSSHGTAEVSLLPGLLSKPPL